MLKCLWEAYGRVSNLITVGQPGCGRAVTRLSPCSPPLTSASGKKVSSEVLGPCPTKSLAVLYCAVSGFALQLLQSRARANVHGGEFGRGLLRSGFLLEQDTVPTSFGIQEKTALGSFLQLCATLRRLWVPCAVVSSGATTARGMQAAPDHAFPSFQFIVVSAAVVEAPANHHKKAAEQQSIRKGTAGHPEKLLQWRAKFSLPVLPSQSPGRRQQDLGEKTSARRSGSSLQSRRNQKSSGKSSCSKRRQNWQCGKPGLQGRTKSHSRPSALEALRFPTLQPSPGERRPGRGGGRLETLSQQRRRRQQQPRWTDSSLTPFPHEPPRSSEGWNHSKHRGPYTSTSLRTRGGVNSSRGSFPALDAGIAAEGKVPGVVAIAVAVSQGAGRLLSC
ncbi:uncharacterized protein LOC141746786 isoform X2 [Larus michahellis]|uniref:uncharacterized protein LOC141737138 isoform X2 n=1 Tax=Larus michahellis TaxID=119627 RepID=UPI003D9BAA3F